MSRTTTRVLAAVAVAGFASVTVAAPALAAPPPPGCKPVKGKPAYPPGQCKPKSISDSSATNGQSITVYSGEGAFDPGAVLTVTGFGPATAFGKRRC